MIWVDMDSAALSGACEMAALNLDVIFPRCAHPMYEGMCGRSRPPRYRRRP